MEILRTPDSCFDNLPQYPYTPNYLDFEGLRMHYLDEGEGEIILALHGEPSWSFLYRKFIPVLKDYRFIAPDLIGFGKSDKLVGWRNYSFELHFRSIMHLINELQLSDITLVVQDWGGPIGLSVLAERPDLFKRVVILNTYLPKGKPLNLGFKLWRAFSLYHPSLPIGGILQFATESKLPKAVVAAYTAPFPNSKYKHGAKAFPALIPTSPDAEGVDRLLKARAVLAEWTKPALVLFSDKDKLMSGLEKFFYRLIPSSKEQQQIIIKDAGHFLQEDKGEEIAAYVGQFIKGELSVDKI